MVLTWMQTLTIFKHAAEDGLRHPLYFLAPAIVGYLMGPASAQLNVITATVIATDIVARQHKLSVADVTRLLTKQQANYLFTFCFLFAFTALLALWLKGSEHGVLIETPLSTTRLLSVFLLNSMLSSVITLICSFIAQWITVRVDARCIRFHELTRRAVNNFPKIYVVLLIPALPISITGSGILYSLCLCAAFVIGTHMVMALLGIFPPQSPQKKAAPLRSASSSV